MASGMRYMFIECQTPDKAKLKNTRGSKSAARAHVTKEFHRKVRLKRRETFVSEVSTSPPPPAQPKVEEVAIKEEARGGRTMMTLWNRSRLDNAHPLCPTQLRVVSFSGTSAKVEAILSISSLYRTCHHSLQRVLDHALVHTWPSTVPTKGHNALENPVNAAWLQASMQYPVVFHAFLYAASLQLLTAYKGQELVKSGEMIRFDHYQKAIHLINKHITELDGPPPDALIMAVTTLAVHGSRAPTPGIECHPQSPLATQQYLHMYGQMLIEESHVSGLTGLIQRKGGIEEMKTYGMADTIALADVYLATKRLQKPLLPLHWPKESLVSTERCIPDDTAVAMSSILGSGFEVLHSDLAGETLCEILEEMCELTVALDQHTRTAQGAPDMVELTTSRNSVQHQLLSLDLTNTEGSPNELVIAEICRIGALIFSEMVLFPLPATQRVKPVLAARLKSLLVSWNVECPSEAQLRVLAWVTMLGCIASTFAAEHDWFLQQLSIHLSTLVVRDWPKLRRLCSTFLWWPPVCDSPGKGDLERGSITQGSEAGAHGVSLKQCIGSLSTWKSAWHAEVVVTQNDLTV